MAKKMTKAEEKALGSLMVLALIIGTPIYIVARMGETIGWNALIGGIVAIVIVYALIKWWRASVHEAGRLSAIEARRSQLLAKYGDSGIVDKIMARTIWQTQTAEQLRDTLGDPVDTDEKVMKAKRREVWKYHPMGANRFGLRVTLENGVVVGWDEKM